MIDPSASVSADATLGAGTRVWDRVKIREGVTIGEDCIIGTGAYIDAGVVIGDRVKIQNAALVYHGVTVESGVFIGPGAVLTNDRFPRSIKPDGELATADDWTLSAIRLGYGSSVGAGAIVVAGCDVGRFATVGAGSVVTHSVPDHALVAGNPARLLGWMCACGQPLLDELGQRIRGTYEGKASCARDGSAYTITAGTCTDTPSANPASADPARPVPAA